MKRRPRLLALVAATLAACAAPPPPPDTTEADIGAIRAISDAFLASFNAGDLTALASLFAEDAMALGPDAPPTVGREAVVAGFASLFEQMEATQTATVEEVALFGDAAYAWGTWEMTVAGPEGTPPAVQTGKWMEVYRRDADGAWKVWRWMWNADAPAAAG